MSIEEVIVARLAATPGVTALVGARIYQLILPQTPTLPAVRVQLISEPGEYHMRGAQDLTRARVQVDSYGSAARTTAITDPYDAVSDVSAAVNAALSGSIFTLGGVHVAAIFRLTRRVLYEGEELRLIRITQDFDVRHEAAA